MKLRKNLFLPSAIALVGASLSLANAADLYWDANGDTTTATGGSGTWNNPNTWRDGSSTGTLGNWVDGNTAVFGGSTSTANVAITADVVVDQMKTLTNGFNIGQSGTGLITFGGSYGDLTPAIDASAVGATNLTITGKISNVAPITGGLVIAHGGNITTPNTSGRLYFTAATAQDFTGDITILSGNVHVLSNLGNPANKIILKGGALFGSSGSSGITYNISRNIEVPSNSGIGSKSDTGGTQNWNLSGPISGSGNLTRYNGIGTGTANIFLQGDMSGYTGVFENTGSVANRSNVSIETTATSGGSWKLSGGTIKLNTTDDTHIANGAGKADLIVDGGILDMNGKSETLNGLSGAGGVVQNELAATVSTLTLGDDDATASFSGSLRDSSGAGGTLALTKIGSGTQTLGGTNTHTGATSVDAGSLVISGSLESSPVTVKTGAAFTMTQADGLLDSLTLEATSTISTPLDAFYVLEVTNAITLSGGTVTIIPTFSSSPELGSTDLIHTATGITDLGTTTLAVDFSSNGATRVAGGVGNDGNTISINVTSLGADLTWNNNAATGIWNLNSDANFLNGASNDTFYQYDAVTFDDSSPAGTITLVGNLLPVAVTVDSANNFTFSGAGSISGSAVLTKDGAGTLTIDNANTSSGDINVLAGTLSGTGSLAGDTLIDFGAFIAPGNSIGTLTGGSVFIDGTYACEIDGATSDKLVVNGDLDLTNTTLTVTELNPATVVNYEIATYTGNLYGSVASVPAGYVVDTSVPGKVLLWKPVPPVGNTITFEEDQSYTLGAIGAIDPYPSAFTGMNGWSLGNGNTGAIVSSSSSGEYFGGQAISSSGSGTYIGGKMGTIEYTGTNTISFDGQTSGTAAIQVGYFSDLNSDGEFDQPDTGMSIGASPLIFARAANFGTQVSSPVTGIAGHWYHYDVSIGESVAGSRDIVLAVRDLTTGVDVDFDAGTGGTQPWSITMTDAEFGVAPEAADGVFVRVTNSVKIDNLRVTSVEPPVGTPYSNWMDNYTAITGSDRDPDVDFDHDGLANGIEFVIGSDPSLTTTTGLPASTVSGGNLVYTFKRSEASETSDVYVEYGTDLVNWPSSILIPAGPVTGPPVDVVDNGAAPDDVTVTIPMGADPKKFARMRVTIAP